MRPDDERREIDSRYLAKIPSLKERGRSVYELHPGSSDAIGSLKQAGMKATELFAQLEGILLDQVYGGKAAPASLSMPILDAFQKTTISCSFTPAAILICTIELKLISAECETGPKNRSLRSPDDRGGENSRGRIQMVRRAEWRRNAPVRRD